MTAVYCFSATGRSRNVAAWFAEKLNTAVRDITDEKPVDQEDAVVVFPVYCQNIPEPVCAFLTELKARNVVLIAAYGRMSHGNVLWEAKHLVTGTVIGAAYVPIGHTYRNEAADFDTQPLLPLLDRIRNPQPCVIERRGKNPFSDLFPALRSQLGVKLRRNENCGHCGICASECPVGAMKDGIPGRKCIRCLRCVERCPEKALDWTLRVPVALYLKKEKKKDIEVFL